MNTAARTSTQPLQPPPAVAVAPARGRRHWWWHYEVPTLLLAGALYLAWAALVWWHAALPGSGW